MNVLLQVSLLGGLSATVMPSSGGSPITHFRTQKTAALFAYLAFHRGIPQAREELIARFWPESELEQGRMSLRTALSALRKDFGEALVADKMSITLLAHTDLADFEQSLRRARQASRADVEKISQLQQAVEYYGGPLLPALYDDWIFPERDRLAAEQRAALTALARWYESLGEPMRAIDFARRATLLAPLDEDLRCELIRLLKDTGQSAEARRQFDDLTRLLDDHLSVKPSPATCALVAGLTESVPSAPVASRRLVQLPLSRGRFRGRREELTALVQRLAGGKSDSEGARLFTLFGPGGMGKTRLAIEAARRVVAHGLVTEAYFASLASATTMEQVWDGIFQALELVHVANLSATTQVAARLQGSSCILVLDNLEQVALEAGEVATALQAEIPNLILLTTSRRRLGTPEETLIAVGALSQEDGVGLFVDRARSVVPSFSPTPREREAIQTLVGRLEGFPLAIELAAAWSSALTPAEMLTQLEAGLLTLPERSRTGDERHSSLSATIRWSVELLSPELRQAFFALALFRGGWFTQAAAEVCQVSREGLASLRDRSLITAQAHGATLRFSMHEALREFGIASLTAVEQSALLTRHAGHFLTLAQQESDPRLLGLEHANFQLALENSQGEQLNALCQALAPFWDQQGHWREGRRWLEQVVATPHTSPAQTAELLHATARLCYSLCDAEAAEGYHRRALALAQEHGDDLGMGRALLGLAGIQAHYQSNYTESHRLTEQAREHFARAGATHGQCACLIGLGVLATIQGNLELALTYQQESLELAEAAGEPQDSATAHHRLGITYLSRQEWESSQEHLRAAEALMEGLHSPAGLAYIRVDLGTLALQLGETERARSYYQASLEVFRELGELWAAALCLGNLARLVRQTGELRQAAVFWQESLALRLLLRDSFSMVSGLDGATNLILGYTATPWGTKLGPDVLAFRAASTAWRRANDAGEVDPEGCEEQEARVRAALGDFSCATLTLEQALIRAQAILQEALAQ